MHIFCVFHFLHNAKNFRPFFAQKAKNCKKWFLAQFKHFLMVFWPLHYRSYHIKINSNRMKWKGFQMMNINVLTKPSKQNYKIHPRFEIISKKQENFGYKSATFRCNLSPISFAYAWRSLSNKTYIKVSIFQWGI